jgi:hypothetical protein
MASNDKSEAAHVVDPKAVREYKMVSEEEWKMTYGEKAVGLSVPPHVRSPGKFQSEQE